MAETSNIAHWGLLIVDKQRKTARFVDGRLTLKKEKGRFMISKMYGTGHAAGKVLCGIDRSLEGRPGFKRGGFATCTLKFVPHQREDNKTKNDGGAACGLYIYRFLGYLYLSPDFLEDLLATFSEKNWEDHKNNMGFDSGTQGTADPEKIKEIVQDIDQDTWRPPSWVIIPGNQAVAMDFWRKRRNTKRPQSALNALAKAEYIKKRASWAHFIAHCKKLEDEINPRDETLAMNFIHMSEEDVDLWMDKLEKSSQDKAKKLWNKKVTLQQLYGRGFGSLPANVLLEWGAVRNEEFGSAQEIIDAMGAHFTSLNIPPIGYGVLPKKNRRLSRQVQTEKGTMRRRNEQLGRHRYRGRGSR
ncbi:hypothetical protein BCR34DRAFT_664456 [Clohesyomyces aquaticus]|uniref:Ubiquitin-like protease family profile domain-containing protein n=1 Tax=Clohesyomyces aquaticus TaxID=1231657 RepID=A0A1Y1ZM46_9PLEO|nr:hypothetical protein BCR34DRAFT_664456 [Clohesyomyces aquaticus]